MNLKKAVDFIKQYLKLHVVKYISTYKNLKLKNHLNEKNQPFASKF